MHYKNITKPFVLAVMSTLLIVAGLQYFYIPTQIKPIHSFNQINFNAIEVGTLVVFDVDETLIQPTDTYFINEYTPKGYAFKKKLFMKHKEIKNWDTYVDIVLKEAERPLIEPMVINEIKKLQQRGITVIACTAMNTGKVGGLQKLEEWRYEHLKSLGFQGSFEDIIAEFSLHKKKPVFYKGVLAVDTLPKGPVLFEFLNHIRLIPDNIIMFDDSLSYLKSVHRECKKRGIPFQGYLYQGAQQKPWDAKLIEFQAEYLIEHKKWLNDKDAQALMAN